MLVDRAFRRHSPQPQLTWNHLVHRLGYEALDAELFFDEWQSEYLMIDGCGVKPRPPPDGPAPGTPGGQARWEMTRWTNLSLDYKRRANKTVLIHDCHNGCGSTFAGPTLEAVPCSASDPAQIWALDLSGGSSGMVDARFGFCVGCGSDTSAGPVTGSCANDAMQFANGTGYGLGMQACIVPCSNNTQGLAGCSGNGLPAGLGKGQQTFNYTKETGLISRTASGECLAKISAGPQVGVMGAAQCAKGSGNGWDAVPVAGGVHLQWRAEPSLCLSSAGATVPSNIDPWCIENNNMWRSNTDVLQVDGHTIVARASMKIPLPIALFVNRSPFIPGSLSPSVNFHSRFWLTKLDLHDSGLHV
jgi:hypothetical protein